MRNQTPDASNKEINELLSLNKCREMEIHGETPLYVLSRNAKYN